MNSVFAMSAKLSHTLLLLVALASFPVATADDGGNTRFGNISMRTLPGKTLHVVVEEIDADGKNEVKELELPDYVDDEDIEEDETKRREQKTELATESPSGCEASDDRERRKCLQDWRKWLRASYENWREAMSRVLDDVDTRIKTLTEEIGRNQ